jgi:hypothetical protein
MGLFFNFLMIPPTFDTGLCELGLVGSCGAMELCVQLIGRMVRRRIEIEGWNRSFIL